MTTTITVDYEHNCESWWTAARTEATSNPPTACVGLLDSIDTITVSDEDAAEFIGWASKIDGWDESPFVLAKDDSEITFSDAYNTGFEAKSNDEDRSANPYSAGTFESDEWCNGWDAAN